MSAKQIVMAAAGASGPVNYIEDVFSTYLYTGTGSAQTITNGIDLAGKGGMLWVKDRTFSAENNYLFDTARGVSGGPLASNLTNQQRFNGLNEITSFNSNGFSVPSAGTTNINNAPNNPAPHNYVSWTFRKQPKFFDIQTFTTNASGGATVSHALGSTPGCVIIKSTGISQNWFVYHRGLTIPNDYMINLNTTAAEQNQGAAVWSASSSAFTINNGTLSNSTAYVAYFFAHDAGGFGLSGTDNVISCGSFTTDGSGNATVSLGYEPQWMITKASTQAENWYINDVMRGYNAPNQGTISGLAANSAAAEAGTRAQYINATGFTVVGGLSASQTYIYIAIRRGPMRVPTSGTSVYNAIARTGTGAAATVTGVGFAPDMFITSGRAASDHELLDRLRNNAIQITNAAAADQIVTSQFDTDVFSTSMDGIRVGSTWNASGKSIIDWFFRRAPGFFDVVCYTGVGAGTSFTHNLGVAPELIIVKLRSSPVSNTAGWFTYHTALGTSSNLLVHTNAASASTTAWNVISSTTVSFNGAVGPVSWNNDTYVAYLFASCPGVSKVGSYTGNGSSQTINCGFTGGARFVLIKRTDSTGDWYVWDTARGIVAADDPHLSLNSTAAEVTTNDSIDPNNSGFIVNQVAATNINVSSATYIYLAIA